MQKSKKIIECALHFKINIAAELDTSCHLNHQDGLEFYKITCQKIKISFNKYECVHLYIILKI
jgi:hypothetical protein